MTVLKVAVDGVLIGVSVAVFAGSEAIRVLETATDGGLRRGLVGGAGVATADGLWAVAFSVLDTAAGGLREHWHGLWKWVALGALLLLGLSVVRDIAQHRTIPIGDTSTVGRSAASLYRSFLGHALLSVVTAVFFISLVTGPDSGHQPTEAVAFVGGVAIGSMLWQTGLAMIGARRSGPLSPVARRRLQWTDCVLLTIFIAYIALAT